MTIRADPPRDHAGMEVLGYEARRGDGGSVVAFDRYDADSHTGWSVLIKGRPDTVTGRRL